MKYLFYTLFLGVLIYSCSSTRDRQIQDTATVAAESDTVRIANDSLEYEIIIIDPGFSYFLNAVAQPEGYHSLDYLENKNQFLVADYNARVRQPYRYDPNIYEMEINYDPKIDYGYDVNYKLYNYFVYLSRKYNQRFSVPTRL
ncbi:hypothetical protein HC174_06980 [Salinimicrobium sp. CDJ15-81-2]|nr:hypothetical protein [Salinimicrobium nanhaiense]